MELRMLFFPPLLRSVAACWRPTTATVDAEQAVRVAEERTRTSEFRPWGLRVSFVAGSIDVELGSVTAAGTRRGGQRSG